MDKVKEIFEKYTVIVRKTGNMKSMIPSLIARLKYTFANGEEETVCEVKKVSEQGCKCGGMCKHLHED